MTKKEQTQKLIKKINLKLPAYPTPAPKEISDLKPKNSWRLSWETGQALVRHWKIFGALFIVYGLLELVVAQSVFHFSISSISGKLGMVSAGQSVGDSFEVFAALFGQASTGGGSSSSAWHFIIATVMSLVIIWVLREIYASKSSREPDFKDAFYESTRPFFPFVLILILIGLELIPMIVGFSLYSFVVSNAIVANLGEQVMFFVVMILLAAVSVYWLTRSVVSLYIVTLPGVEPLDAFDEALRIVDGRRWSVARKLVFLPIAMFVIAAIIIVPCIMLYGPLAQWVFFLLTILSIFVAHTYLYLMYRSLLDEPGA